jgi:segregation and condensation protein B
MSDVYIRNVVEAALLAAGRPLQLAELAQLFEEHARPDSPALRTALSQLAAEYEGRGIEVRETASGFRIQVRAGVAPEVSRLWPERPGRYSRALLETLALIAYRQPITRGEIEAVRGVAVNPNIIKTVMERNWVRVVGHREVPGRPELLGTTREFLDYFGLKSLDELPALAEIKVLGDPPPVQLELAVEGAASPPDGSPARPATAAADPDTGPGGEAVDGPAPGAADAEEDEEGTAAADGKTGMAAGPQGIGE